MGCLGFNQNGALNGTLKGALNGGFLLLQAGTSCPDVNENPKKSSALFSEIGNSSTTVRRIHGNFVGLEKADDATRGTMLNFTVSMTLGKLDEAFRAIASIKRFDIS